MVLNLKQRTKIYQIFSNVRQIVEAVMTDLAIPQASTRLDTTRRSDSLLRNSSKRCTRERFQDHPLRSPQPSSRRERPASAIPTVIGPDPSRGSTCRSRFRAGHQLRDRCHRGRALLGTSVLLERTTVHVQRI